jgi:hypothetical protein
MSEKSAPVEGDFAPAADPGAGDASNGRIELEPGESVSGRITEINLDAGRNGLIELDGQTLWLNNRMRRQLLAQLEGRVTLAEKEDQERSFEDDNGETVTYHQRNLRFTR